MKETRPDYVRCETCLYYEDDTCHCFPMTLRDKWVKVPSNYWCGQWRDNLPWYMPQSKNQTTKPPEP